jgi:hypothetical protein
LFKPAFKQHGFEELHIAVALFVIRCQGVSPFRFD